MTETKSSKTVEEKSGSVFSGRRRNRAAAYIKLVPDPQRSAGHALDLLSAEFRNDGTPLADSGGAQTQRPRDIRGFLEVIENFAFEHDHSLSPLKSAMQAHSNGTVLTSVHMEKLNDLADRLSDAMKEAKVGPSDLARECRVSPAAVTKWTNRETKKLSADNYDAAARALGVSADWLRTGKLPRERNRQEVQLEKLQSALMELRDPLAAVLAAINELAPPGEPHRKRRSGG